MLTRNNSASGHLLQNWKTVELEFNCVLEHVSMLGGRDPVVPCFGSQTQCLTAAVNVNTRVKQLHSLTLSIHSAMTHTHATTHIHEGNIHAHRHTVRATRQPF